MRPFVISAIIVSLGAIPALADNKPAANDPCLHGVWEVVEWSDLNAEGIARFPDRTAVEGRFIYTPEGRMSVQVMLAPDAAPVKGRQDVEGLAESARNTIEYFGSYEADRAKGTLLHRIVGSGLPNRRGNDAARNYALEDGVLRIFWTEANGNRFSRVLRLIERLGNSECDR